MAVPSNWPQTIKAAGGAYVPLTVFSNEPIWRVMTFKNVDLTGAEFVGKVRAAFEDSSAVLRDFFFGTPTLVGADTVVTFAMNAPEVETLRTGTDPGAIETLFYNIQYTPDGGILQTLFAGELFIQGA